jgi:hypothetical protein
LNILWREVESIVDEEHIHLSPNTGQGEQVREERGERERKAKITKSAVL